MNIAVWLALPVTFIGLGIAIFVVMQKKARAEHLAKLASHLNLKFAAHPSADDQACLSRFRFLAHPGGTLSNALVSEHDGVHTLLCDYHFKHTFTDPPRTADVTQTIICIRSSIHIPFFLLTPENWTVKLAHQLVHDVDFRDDPEFSNRFSLEGQDPEVLRKFFDESLRKALLQRKGWSCEGNHDSLLMYRPGRLCEPQQLRVFLQEAQHLHQAFAARLKRP